MRLAQKILDIGQELLADRFPSIRDTPTLNDELLVFFEAIGRVPVWNAKADKGFKEPTDLTRAILNGSLDAIRVSYNCICGIESDCG
jgi:hypothetical protein